MLAFMVDLATIGATFFLGLAVWHLGTYLQRKGDGAPTTHASEQYLATTERWTSEWIGLVLLFFAGLFE
jgi:hypothetical protein